MALYGGWIRNRSYFHSGFGHRAFISRAKPGRVDGVCCPGVGEAGRRITRVSLALLKGSAADGEGFGEVLLWAP